MHTMVPVYVQQQGQLQVCDAREDPESATGYIISYVGVQQEDRSPGMARSVFIQNILMDLNPHIITSVQPNK